MISKKITQIAQSSPRTKISKSDHTSPVLLPIELQHVKNRNTSAPYIKIVRTKVNFIANSAVFVALSFEFCLTRFIGHRTRYAYGLTSKHTTSQSSSLCILRCQFHDVCDIARTPVWAAHSSSCSCSCGSPPINLVLELTQLHSRKNITHMSQAHIHTSCIAHPTTLVPPCTEITTAAKLRTLCARHIATMTPMSLTQKSTRRSLDAPLATRIEQ